MEKDRIMSDGIRIGIFICHCGSNIGGTVNVPEVVEYARTLPYVVCAEGNLYTCSEDGLSSIRNKIREDHLNRVVVASCTPRTHEGLFRKNCERADLNKYLFEFVNLREHCAWVHMNQPEEATAKAKDLVRMGAAKVGLLEPLTDLSTNVMRACLVLGGGVSGLTAALTLANQGYRVELVEKEKNLGGLLLSVNRIFPTHQTAAEFLAPTIRSVLDHKNITVHLGWQLSEIKGFIGNYAATVKKGDKTLNLEVGTITVAVGAAPFKPTGLYGYGRFENVMTQIEFEKLSIQSGYSGFNNIVIINCVGARTEERSYCGRFCCIVALKNAILIKEANPDARVTIMQRDVMACGKIYEDYYRIALEKGIQFVRYDPNQPPKVLGSDQKATKVCVRHLLMGKDITLDADLVLLTTPLVPGEDNVPLSRIMRIPLGMDGFFMEAHQKLRPVEFPTDGIFVAGCARYPGEIPECISQGHAAAAKAAVPMANGLVVTEAYTSEVDPTRCSACGRCITICPFGAVDWAENASPQNGASKVAKVNATECKGCGLCVSSCLSSAIRLRGFSDGQIFAMIDNLN